MIKYKLIPVKEDLGEFIKSKAKNKETWDAILVRLLKFKRKERK